MRSRLRGGRAGAAGGDALLMLAAMSLLAAAAFPAWSARSFRAGVGGAIADVDAVVAAARAARESTGRWPASVPHGEAPRELATLGGPGAPFSRTEYTLGWDVWSVLDSVPAPPDQGPAPADAPADEGAPRLVPRVASVGGITLRTSDPALLAALLRHYGERSAFVLDSALLLILTERAGPSTPQ